MEEETLDDKLFFAVKYGLLKLCKQLKDSFKVFSLYNILSFYSFFFFPLVTNKDNNIDFI